MKPVVLLPDGAKYAGQYVCFKSFADRTVVSHDNDPTKTIRKAEKNGFPHAVILYVPKKDILQIY